MKERTRDKHLNQDRYLVRNKEITRKINAAKEGQIYNPCQDVEDLQNKHDSFQLNKRIKKISGNYRITLPGNLVDN